MSGRPAPPKPRAQRPSPCSGVLCPGRAGPGRARVRWTGRQWDSDRRTRAARSDQPRAPRWKMHRAGKNPRHLPHRRQAQQVEPEESGVPSLEAQELGCPVPGTTPFPPGEGPLGNRGHPSLQKDLVVTPQSFHSVLWVPAGLRSSFGGRAWPRGASAMLPRRQNLFWYSRARHTQLGHQKPRALWLS